MKEYWLVVVDTTQIQPYIFGSNRLAENIGASWLVKQATGPWALRLAQKVALRNNILVAENNELDSKLHLEDGKLDAEVIYAAGGNVIALFVGKEQAIAFIRGLSRLVLCQAPGLQLLFAKQPVDWEKLPIERFDWVAHPGGEGFDRKRHAAGLFNAVMRAFGDLEAQKGRRAHDAPLLGLGVTMACQSTGRPAIRMQAYSKELPRPVSAEIECKVNAASDSHNDLREQFGRAIGAEYDFPRDFDDLGRRKGEQSFIAVVHADGNGLGQAMIDTGKRNSHDNRQYIQAVRARSQAVARASSLAMQDTLDLLWRCIIPSQDETGRECRCLQRWVTRSDNGDTREEVAAKIVLRRDGGAGQWWLPFRPLVYGGDDTTFVCDGRIGVSLAVEYLSQFQEHATRELNQPTHPTTACAGVAIVKSHYPFSRAYELAEDLCGNAKRFRAQEEVRTGQPQGSFLDWHFAVSGLLGDLGDIREREYTVKEGNLCLRPLALDWGEPPKIDVREARRWSVLVQALGAFQGQNWAGRRNKVKTLRDALRQGKTAVERFIMMYDMGSAGNRSLPELSAGDSGDHRRHGWLDSIDNDESRCAYFDAIELADMHMPLVPPQPSKEAA